jgi:hypothetical protein
MWGIAASTALYRALVWWIGDPSAPTARGHFANLSTLAATAAIGLLVWWYHRAVLAGGPQAGRTEISRIYEYLIAAIGLVAGAAGLATVIIAIFDAFTGSRALAGGSAVNTLLAAATLLVVGLPFWWIFWNRAEAAAKADPAIEIPSVARRSYLFALFGVGGIIAIVSLLVAVYAFFADLVESRLSFDTVRDMRIPLSILIATGLVSAFHIAVYRRDRSLGIVDEHLTRLQSIILVGGDEQLRRAVADQTGVHVHLWQRTDVDGMEAIDTRDRVLAALTGVTAEEVIVLPREGVIEVIPIRRGR